MLKIVLVTVSVLSNVQLVTVALTVLSMVQILMDIAVEVVGEIVSSQQHDSVSFTNNLLLETLIKSCVTMTHCLNRLWH